MSPTLPLPKVTAIFCILAVYCAYVHAGDITVSIHTLKDNYLSGEPLSAVLKIRNNTKEAVLISYYPQFDPGLSVEVTPNTAAKIKKLRPAVKCGGSNCKMTNLPPGKDMEGQFCLNRFITPNGPGTFRMKWRYYQTVGEDEKIWTAEFEGILDVTILKDNFKSEHEVRKFESGWHNFSLIQKLNVLDYLKFLKDQLPLSFAIEIARDEGIGLSDCVELFMESEKVDTLCGLMSVLVSDRGLSQDIMLAALAKLDRAKLLSSGFIDYQLTKNNNARANSVLKFLKGRRNEAYFPESTVRSLVQFRDRTISTSAKEALESKVSDYFKESDE